MVSLPTLSQSEPARGLGSSCRRRRSRGAQTLGEGGGRRRSNVWTRTTGSSCSTNRLQKPSARLPVAFCCGETDALWTQWTLERRQNTILEKFKEKTATLPVKKKSLGFVNSAEVFPVPCW
ncbi:hypothetical protein NQZ68_001256 [Dissostichus eleginoides]|nr:hypothetical protein NQZ68_001256 [Dissostichus eleginoides]